jgi:hypothetical protein
MQHFLILVAIAFLRTSALADFADIACSPQITPNNIAVEWSFTNTNSFTVIMWSKGFDCKWMNAEFILPRERRAGNTFRVHTFLVTDEADEPVDSYVVKESATQHWDIEDKRKDKAVAKAVVIPVIPAETSTEQSVQQEPDPPTAVQEPSKNPVLPPPQPEPIQETQPEVRPIEQKLSKVPVLPLLQPEPARQDIQQEVSPNVQEQLDPTARSPASLTQPEMQLDQQSIQQRQQQQVHEPKDHQQDAVSTSTQPNDDKIGAGKKLQGSRSSVSQIDHSIVIIASIIGAVILSIFASIGFLLWNRKKRKVEKIKQNKVMRENVMCNEGLSASHTPSLFSHWNLWGFNQQVIKESFACASRRPVAIRTNYRHTQGLESIGGSGFWLASCASTLHSRDSVDLELTDNDSVIHTERRESFPRIVEVLVLQGSAV